MTGERVQRRLAAILAADVVGYTRLMEQDEAGTVAAVRAQRETLEPLVASHRGRIFKIMGDGVLVEFSSAIDAVECAVAFQKALAEAAAETPLDRRAPVRIGINLGDVVVEAEDLYGDGVNLAARLQQHAEPGGICVSAKVRDEVGSKIAVGFEEIGERRLKNVAAPVRLFKVGAHVARSAVPAALPLPDKPSIAVLPFDNLSGDAEQQYFSDGIADDVITDLSKIAQLFVIARNSSFTYRGKSVKVQDVSRELGVRYVVEGSARKVGNRVRLAVQLIDGSTGGHVWAERYDRVLTDVFAVQDAITREIVSALALRLTRNESSGVEGPATASEEAYDCYLRGRQLLRERSAERNREARTLLERAIELDGRFSDAFAALAGVHVLDYVNRWRGPAEESRRLSRAAAERAVALDGRSANAHWALGLIHMGDNQLERAIAEAREALALDPNFAVAHSLLGQALYYAGQSEDALQSLSTAVRLDPYNDLFLHLLAHVHFGNEQYEEAAATLKRRILRKPDTDLSRVLLASCCGHLGRTDEARALWREVFQVPIPAIHSNTTRARCLSGIRETLRG